MLKTRVLTALLMGAVLALALFLFPDWAWGLFVAAIVGVACREWSRLVKSGPVERVVFAALAVLPVVVFGLSEPNADTRLVSGAAYLASLVLWTCSVPLFLRNQMRLEGLYGRVMFGLVVLVPAGMAMIALRRESPLLLLAVMAPVWIADTAAYFAGRRWGRVKLAPTISPGKTREGALAGLLAVLLYAAVIHLLVSDAAALMGLHWMLLLAAMYVVLSVLGDLFESLLKRLAEVKDSGTLLPGHGGVLDRIDSMLPTLPLAACLWLLLA